MAKKPYKITPFKRFKRFLVRMGFWSFYFFMGFMPASWAYALGRLGGKIAIALPFKHRHTIFQNLALAYEEEKTQEEQRSLAGRVFANIGELMADLILLSRKAGVRRSVTVDRSSENERRTANIIIEKITLEGKENLDKALAPGKGVVALTGHMGLFVLITPRLNAEGYNSWVVADYQYDPHLEKHIENVKANLGVRTIMTQPKDRCLAASLSCLNDNGILVLLMDEDGKRKGIFVDFFGRPASTATGPAAMIQRTGAAVAPMAMIYEGQGRHRLVIEPPLTLAATGDFAADMAANTALFTKAIEAMIRKRPEQWAWINKRWKTQPSPVAR